MNVIDAYWDKENLGMDVYEVKLDNSDLEDLPELTQKLSVDKFKNAYLVVKLPVSNIKPLHFLEDNGFRFMETQFHMKKMLKNYETPRFITHLKNVLEQREIEKTEKKWEKITSMMTNDMFYTDRIYLDPKLSKRISCKRYQNWIMNSVDTPNTHLFAYYHEDTPIGFSFSRIDLNKKIVFDLLAGIFEKYQDRGFGYMMFDCALKNYQKQGLEKLETSISSNNMPILNLDQAFGYVIVKEEYVLRKLD